jgi:ACS family allantoate permease-like MFS transporter
MFANGNFPDNPRTAKWLNERDRAILLARIKENNAGTVDHTWKKAQAVEALLSFNLWSNAFISGSAGIPNAVFSSFGTLVISGFWLQ